VRIEPRWGLDALRNTVRAMLDGAPAIHPPLAVHDREV
jgi:hypothetical protein